VERIELGAGGIALLGRRGEVDEADVEGRLAPRGVAHVGLLGVGGDEDARSGTRGPRDAPRGHPAYRGLRPGPAYHGHEPEGGPAWTRQHRQDRRSGTARRRW